jgi:thioesterase domain-containing protein
MATHLRGAERTEGWSPLVTIQAGGSEPPVFAVHPVGGNVVCYLELARGLGKGRPIYALQARGLEPGQEPLATVEAMAALYLDAIKGVQPQGPYFLVGWSMGGVVAFEIARALRALGDEVALLAMIDAYPPEASVEDIDSAIVAAMFARDLGRSFGKDLDVTLDALTGRSADEQLEVVLARAMTLGALPPDVGPERLRLLAQTFVANRKASARYRPEAFDGLITHFAATESLAAGGETTGWEHLATRGVEVHSIPGDHYSIMRHELLASGLRASLARIAQRT